MPYRIRDSLHANKLSLIAVVNATTDEPFRAAIRELQSGCCRGNKQTPGQC